MPAHEAIQLHQAEAAPQALLMFRLGDSTSLLEDRRATPRAETSNSSLRAKSSKRAWPYHVAAYPTFRPEGTSHRPIQKELRCRHLRSGEDTAHRQTKIVRARDHPHRLRKPRATLLRSRKQNYPRQSLSSQGGTAPGLGHSLISRTGAIQAVTRELNATELKNAIQQSGP